MKNTGDVEVVFFFYPGLQFKQKYSFFFQHCSGFAGVRVSTTEYKPQVKETNWFNGHDGAAR